MKECAQISIIHQNYPKYGYYFDEKLFEIFQWQSGIVHFEKEKWTKYIIGVIHDECDFIRSPMIDEKIYNE